VIHRHPNQYFFANKQPPIALSAQSGAVLRSAKNSAAKATLSQISKKLYQ
jgi:hypothetical protein